MGKQLSFNKTEQKQIQIAITKLVSIMMKKHGEGVNSPNLSGTVEINNENLQCKFDIQIQPK
jgi:hypothetical protein